MKTQLIMLPQPILVSDEEVSGRMAWNPDSRQIEFFASHPKYNESGLKIIAGYEKLPSIDFSALSEEDCKKIGWVDVENWVDKEFKEEFEIAQEAMPAIWYDFKLKIIKFIKTTQSLNEKKFSLVEIAVAFEAGRTFEVSEHESLNQIEYLQSLSQPKVFDVEVEKEYRGSLCHKCNQISNNDNYDGEHCPSCHNYSTYTHIYEPKITNNSIKIIKVL